MQRWLIYLIAGWSGFAVMGLELLGGRLLAPYFGSSIYVWGAIITVFMLALSLGYLAGGRVSLHSPDLRRLALILVTAAAATLPVVLGGQWVLDRLATAIPDPRFGSLAGAALLFLLPTLLAGMVSPYAVRLLVAEQATSGQAAGRLYFVSTFGSAAGTLMTSFYLVLYLEVGQILLLFMSISVLIGVAAWISGARRWSAAAMLCAAIVCAPTSPAVQASTPAAATGDPGIAGLRLLHSENSLYRQVLVYEGNGIRCLCFTRGCAIGRQSCSDLQDPQRLIFDYTQMMLGALYLAPEPRHILIIGLGGGTLPRALRTLLPSAEIDVVEIDPAVTRVAAQYFGFQADPQTRVFEQDGRVYVRQALTRSQRYDLIMLDAYDHQYIPEHLLTREFLQQVRALLLPAGIVAANTFSASRLYSNESVTYDAVFGQFYNLKRDNRVILATNGPLPPPATVLANSRRFESAFLRLGFSGSKVLALFSTQHDWDAQARVLTDQYSPANLLNGPGK